MSGEDTLMKRVLSACVVMLVTMVAGGLVLAQAEPLVGTWKLDVAKSKFSTGVGPRSQTRTWGADGKVSVSGVNAAGAPVTYSYTIKPDGKPYPTTGAVPNGADSVSSKRIDASTIDSSFTKGGKATDTTRFAVSKDGRTLTLTAKGTQADGKPLDDVLIYVKQ
jgi:hypothetical protein